MLKSVFSLGIAFCLVAAVDTAAEPLRIMTYNILNYSSGRTAEFQTALSGIDPDIIVVEEVLSQSGVNTWLSSVLDVLAPGEFAPGAFVNGPDTDAGMYYRTSRVQYLGHHVISTTLRDIDEWTVRPVGYTTSTADVRLYAVHLKASSSSSDEAQRLAEVTTMRSRMETFPVGGNYLVLGDFNIYTSSEPAYQYMLALGGGPAGVVVDPIDTPGNWHNTAAFAAIHSQSPRTTQFGGGANGGLDDRFDMILTSPSLTDGNGFEYVPGTYTTHGQDGLHFNLAIIDPPENQAVSAEVALALHNASDHLPVYADFRLASILVADAALDLGLVIVGGEAGMDLSVANGAESDADDLDYTLSPPAGFTAPPGPFSALGGDPANLHAIDVDTSEAGAFTGDLLIESDAVDAPSFPVALMATVLDHAAPSVMAGSVVTETTVDFGVHEVGGFSDQILEAHNVGFDALHALLEIYDATLSGDPRFSIVGGFDPVTVDDGPASWSIAFDDTGALDGVYEAMLVLATRDQQDLSGSIDLSDLTFSFAAEVDGGVVTAPGEAPAVVAGIHRVFPNPFRPATSIGYGLTETGAVRLDIFDVAGRRVRQLVNATLAAGGYEIGWDGRDDASRDVGPGIYYVRLVTPTMRETQRVVRIR